MVNYIGNAYIPNTIDPMCASHQGCAGNHGCMKNACLDDAPECPQYTCAINVCAGQTGGPCQHDTCAFNMCALDTCRINFCPIAGCIVNICFLFNDDLEIN